VFVVPKVAKHAELLSFFAGPLTIASKGAIRVVRAKLSRLSDVAMAMSQRKSLSELCCNYVQITDAARFRHRFGQMPVD